MDIQTIEIHFKRSRSKHYKKCLHIASSFRDFQFSKEDNEFNILRLSLYNITNRLKDVNSLVQKVKKWDTTSFKLNGKFDTISVESIFSFIDRFLRCSNDPHFFTDEDHCKYTELFGLEHYGWGCRYLDSVKFDERDIDNDNPYWYEMGHLNDNEKWVIDKERIISLLKKEAETNFINTCSLYDEKRIMYFIGELPEFIDLSTEPNWAKIFSKKGTLKTIKRKDISANPKPVNRPSDNDFHSNRTIFDTSELDIDYNGIARQVMDEILDKYFYPRETLDLLKTRGTICAYCKHFSKSNYNCIAFPEKIPNDIICGKSFHFNYYKGQHGDKHFELSNEYTIDDIKPFFNP